MRSAALGSFQTLWFWSFFLLCREQQHEQGTLFFYLEETTASQEGNGQKPSEIKTYSDFAKRKRDPSSSIFVILSVTTSSSKKIVDPGNGETNKFSAFNVNRTA